MYLYIYIHTFTSSVNTTLEYVEINKIYSYNIL